MKSTLGMMAGLVLAALATAAVRMQESDRTALLRIAVALVLTEATNTEARPIVVDSLLDCRPNCRSTMPPSVVTYLRDTARVRIAPRRRVIRCVPNTNRPTCMAPDNPRALIFFEPLLRGDTARVSHTWTELFRGRLWGHGEERQFIRRQGRWHFDKVTNSWTS